MTNENKKRNFISNIQHLLLGDDVFQNNELTSNLFVANVMGIMAIIFCIVAILTYAGYFQFDNITVTYDILLCIAQLMIGILLYFLFKDNKTWLKYMEMLLLCLTISCSHAIFGFSATISLSIPVIVSTKYLSERFTKVIAVFSGILMFFSNIATVYWSINPDLNNVVLATGTVITIETTLTDAVRQLPILMTEYLKAQLIGSFLPCVLQYILISIICVAIAKWGHFTVLEQAKISSKLSRVDTELTMAKDIQENMLPNTFPAFPNRKEIDIFATMTPAKEVGGDFYDFFFVDDDHLALIIADVSGKGMPAALFMMMGKTLIKNQAMLGSKPEDILRIVNHQLCENNKSGLFITAWIGILELSSGKMTAANAGHEYPIIKHKDGQYELIKDKHGFVLGGMDNMKYHDYSIELQRGDRIFVYTDGVTEATDINQQLFGMNRLLESLNSISSSSEEEIIEEVHNKVNLFAGTAPQADDITMLGLTYVGKNSI